jgi:DNA mismatch repair protein MutS
VFAPPRSDAFQSILFDRFDEGVHGPPREAPAFFGDLHLDQIVASVTAGREEYELVEYFHRPLPDVEAICYRHAVLRDLEQEAVAEVVRAFARAMLRMRGALAWANKLHYGYQRKRWYLEAVSVYCSAVRSFGDELSGLDLRSAGFVALREYLQEYVESGDFRSLVTETRDLEEQLAGIGYALHIKGARIRVTRYDGAPDMSTEVEQTFMKFKHGAVNDYRIRFREPAEMNHVEAQILDLVARLHPQAFSALDQFWGRHRSYLDVTVSRFDREVQFYLAYLDYTAPLKSDGLGFSYPRVSAQSKRLHATEAFDLALASRLVGENATVVRNDFDLTDSERILVVTGPNQGGKTTFARMFGQMHYLASLGLPVPGAEARLFLPDRLFTHFEREENLQTLRGKFEDELIRIHEILDQATPSSMVIANETFGSTSLRDALAVGRQVMEQIIELDVICVFVTFVDEIASLGESTVSMMSTVVPDDPAERTYKVVRRAADGLAYAAAIADKYGLNYESLRGRIAR